MTTRLDLQEGLKLDLHTWFWEQTDKIYKTLPKYYRKMVELLPLKAIKGGGFWKGTSALGAEELKDRVNDGKLAEDLPQEGYPVYAVIKDKALKVKVPKEMMRDWHRTENWLRDYVKQHWPKAIDVTIEKIVADLFNYGGYTAGHKVFNNNDSTIPLTTYTSPDLAYDGQEFFNRAGRLRALKSETTGTFYNALAVTTGAANAGVTFANAKTMRDRMVSINNVMDNGGKFDNKEGLSVLCHPVLEMDWAVINNSTQNPDNAENAINPMKGAFKNIIGNPYLNTTIFSCLLREGLGIKLFLGEPKFNYWEKNDPPTGWASVIFDYAICVQNWRPFLSNNAPTSA